MLGRVITNLNLRQKVLALMLVVLLPPLCVNMMLVYYRFHYTMERELQSDQEIAQIMAFTLEWYLETLWDMQESAGKTILMDSHTWSPQRIENLLHSLHAVHPTIQSLLWVQPSGRVLTSTAPALVGVSLATRDYIQRILAGEGRVVSDLIIGQDQGHPTFVVAHAIRQGNQLYGIMAAAVSIDKLNSVLVEVKYEDGMSGIVDRNGLPIYTTGKDREECQKPAFTEEGPIQQALNTKSSVLARRFKSIRGSPSFLGASEYIPSIGWVAYTVSPLQVVLATAMRETHRSILILMIGIALALVLGTLASAGLLDPIQSLQRASAAITKGDLSARAHVNGRDELAALATAFNSMAERIQSLETSRNTLIKIAAHEIRNPLAGIKGILGLLKRRMSNPQDCKTVDMLEIAEREVDRANALLHELSDAIYIQQGRLSLTRLPVDFASIVMNALRAVQTTLANNPQHVLHWSIDPSVPVIGDASRLEQVVHNLLTNAVKYSPNGGSITITLTTTSSKALLSVQDQGLGIPKQVISHVFESFYRVPNPSYASVGAGLGLYICKDVVEQHGGRIWVESEEGQGSTFFVELPLDQDVCDNTTEQASGQ